MRKKWRPAIAAGAYGSGCPDRSPACGVTVLCTSKSRDPTDPGEPVVDAVRDVWASVWNFAAIEAGDRIDLIVAGSSQAVAFGIEDHDVLDAMDSMVPFSCAHDRALTLGAPGVGGRAMDRALLVMTAGLEIPKRQRRGPLREPGDDPERARVRSSSPSKRSALRPIT